MKARKVNVWEVGIRIVGKRIRRMEGIRLMVLGQEFWMTIEEAQAISRALKEYAGLAAVAPRRSKTETDTPRHDNDRDKP